MTEQNNFHDTVMAIASRKGFSVRKIATGMGVNHSQISRPLNGKTSFKRDWLIYLCRVLDCSPQETAEIFAQTDYRLPDPDELDEEESVAA